MPRKRPRSPVSAVAKSAAFAGSRYPSQVASSGMLVDHVAGHEPADLTDRTQVTDAHHRAVVEEGLFIGGDPRRPHLEHHIEQSRRRDR